jgi:hypothetical protein
MQFCPTLTYPCNLGYDDLNSAKSRHLLHPEVLRSLSAGLFASEKITARPAGNRLVYRLRNG